MPFPAYNILNFKSRAPVNDTEVVAHLIDSIADVAGVALSELTMFNYGGFSTNNEIESLHFQSKVVFEHKSNFPSENNFMFPGSKCLHKANMKQTH